LTRNNGGQLQLIIYTDVRQETGENEQVTYVATEITMPIGVVDYGSIVRAIIDAHYSFDQMQAIVNNYLIQEHLDEFQEMQDYRLYAKEIARMIVEDISKENEVSNG
jgi:homospermidine synthase